MKNFYNLSIYDEVFVHIKNGKTIKCKVTNIVEGTIQKGKYEKKFDKKYREILVTPIKKSNCVYNELQFTISEELYYDSIMMNCSQHLLSINDISEKQYLSYSQNNFYNFSPFDKVYVCLNSGYVHECKIKKIDKFENDGKLQYEIQVMDAKFIIDDDLIYNSKVINSDCMQLTLNKNIESYKILYKNRMLSEMYKRIAEINI